MQENRTIYEILLQEKEKQELADLVSFNQKTESFRLSLSQKEARELAACRNESLRKWRRVEFGKSILTSLIWTFCDSPYLNQDNYAETLQQLQDIFYEFKNETSDRMTDQELLNFMREQFDGVCFGDASYLEETCLSRLAAGIRAGYTGFHGTDGRGSYHGFNQETRWDADLYMEALKDLCWR